MRRHKAAANSTPPQISSTNSRSNAEAEWAIDRMLKDFWEVHQKIITKIENRESPSPEELAEAALNQRLLTERLERKREESAKAAKELLDAIDLEP